MLSKDEFLDAITCPRNMAYLNFNKVLLEAFHDNIIDIIKQEILKNGIHREHYNILVQRLMPINIIPKYVDKLTNIYNGSVLREVENPNENILHGIELYKNKMSVDDNMDYANEMYNLFRCCLIQPYSYDGQQHLRIVPNDRFIPISKDPYDPSKLTDLIVIHSEDCYFLYSDEQILVLDGDGRIINERMDEMGLDGTNPIGLIPFVYVNSSRICVFPKPQYDLLAVSLLIPMMLTDLNAAAMMQSFSILWTKDIDSQEFVYAPGAVWQFASSPLEGVEPEIGTIKPQVDYGDVLNLIQSQFTVWLSTKGIRASTVGNLSAENFVSGISKIIDEMDTVEARKKQIKPFQKAEKDLWSLVLTKLHPFWRSLGEVNDVSVDFPSDIVVNVRYAEQLPIVNRESVVKEQALEVSEKFTTRRRAIQKLNPEMTSEEIDRLIEEIDEEQSSTKPNQENSTQSQDKEDVKDDEQDQAEEDTEEFPTQEDGEE